jgi:hypothetical protein
VAGVVVVGLDSVGVLDGVGFGASVAVGLEVGINKVGVVGVILDEIDVGMVSGFEQPEIDTMTSTRIIIQRVFIHLLREENGIF